MREMRRRKERACGHVHGGRRCGVLAESEQPADAFPGFRVGAQQGRLRLAPAQEQEPQQAAFGALHLAQGRRQGVGVAAQQDRVQVGVELAGAGQGELA